VLLPLKVVLSRMIFEITEGMRFGRGFHPFLFCHRPQITKSRIRKTLHSSKREEDFSPTRYPPSLEIAAQARRPFVMIAEDINGEALAVCILNELRGQLQVAAVNAPGFGD